MDLRKEIEYFNFLHPCDRQGVGNFFSEEMRRTNQKFNIPKSHPFYHYADKRYLTNDDKELKSEEIISEIEKDIIRERGMTDFLKLLLSCSFRNPGECLNALDIHVLKVVIPEYTDSTVFANKIVDKLHIQFAKYYGNLNKVIYYTTIAGITDRIVQNVVDKCPENIEKDVKILSSMEPVEFTDIYYLSRHIETVIVYLKRLEEWGIIIDSRAIDVLVKKNLSMHDNINSEELFNLLKDTGDFSNSILEEIRDTNRLFLKPYIDNENAISCATFDINKLYDTNYTIFDTVSFISDNIKETLLKKHTNCIFDIDGRDRMVLDKLGFLCVPVTTVDTQKLLLLAIDKDYTDIYLLAKQKDIILISLTESDAYIKFTIEKSGPTEFDKHGKFKIKRIKTNEKPFKEEMLTEGINVSKDGTVSFSFRPKKSFMDEYMSIHNVLVQNDKTGNVEGMKQNLIHIYLLLDKIEEERFKKKIYQTEDLIKARSFVMNDFKTYLKKIQKSEPKFDFYEYLKSSDYSKVFIKITPDNIKGVKKILKTLLV